MKEGSEFEGKLIILTAPSGGGKTTIKRHLLKTYAALGFSVSVTTRDMREHEVEGADYYFKSVEEFKALRAEQAFIEWEEVYDGQYYGTLKTEVERLWSEGQHIVFDIDVHGARDLKEKYGDRCLAIFIRPPSLQVIIERLKNRQTESEQSLKKRIKRIKREMMYENEFDTIIVNDLLDVTLKEAELKVETFLDISEEDSPTKI